MERAGSARNSRCTTDRTVRREEIRVCTRRPENVVGRIDTIVGRRLARSRDFRRLRRPATRVVYDNTIAKDGYRIAVER